jgi:hypothetical protein
LTTKADLRELAAATKSDIRDLGRDMRGEIARQGAANEARFVKIEGELALLKWMVGFNLAATVGVLFFLPRH